MIKKQMPDAKIIMLTTSIEDNDLFEAIKSGACGYLLKSMDSDQLVEALEQTRQGLPPFSPGLAEKLLQEFSRLSNPDGEPCSENRLETDTKKPQEGLTPRQIQVLKLLADGLGYKEIGARLFLSPRTIKYHMTEIMDRLHLENRAQVLAFAGQMGLTAQKPSQ
jgi:two-component system NarL family response regulator